MRRLLVLLLLIGIPHVATGDDIDIYGVAQIDVKPNVLIIFDNSGSMGTTDVPGDPYDPNITYPGGNTNKVYRGTTEYFSDINLPEWQCGKAKTALLQDGYWQGKLKKDKKTQIITCGGKKSKAFRTGNFKNFDDSNLGDKRKRMVVAKEVIAKLISDNVDTVKFGLMKFHHSEGGHIASPCAENNRETLIGQYDPASPPVFYDSDQSGLYGEVGRMEAETWTPLGETAAEAGLYFAGKPSWFNTTGYTGSPDGTLSSPIEYRCQKNYIILMTDGAPTQDDNSKLSDDQYINDTKIPDAKEDGVPDYLDDVAYFLRHNDLREIGENPSEAEKISMGIPGDFESQTVTTYTIGFQQNLALLQDTADRGGGAYYTADNASTLNEALNAIITAIKEENENFSAAAVPVSRSNQAYAGNFVYYGLFQPTATTNWIGNIKKYNLEGGVIKDINGMPIIENGVILNNAQSYWSTEPDGNNVASGGVGEKLLLDIEEGKVREIYTYTGTTPNLTDTSNQFETSNATLNATNYSGLTPAVIDYVLNEDGDYPLGDFLHSQPIVVHYDDNSDGQDDHSIVYIGGNDGMLHAFDDDDGSELWGYIPSDLLDSLDAFAAETEKQYHVDGVATPTSYDHDGSTATPNKKLLVFGERRGGYSYTALDITDYNAPKWQYELGMDILGAGKEILGQSWGQPKPLAMAYTDGAGDTHTKDVLLLPGGYDDNQDGLPTDVTPPAPNDSKGRAVFAVDKVTGAVFDNATFTNQTNNDMTHSIIAMSGFENPKSRTTTRLYAGDMNGNLFAFRDDIYHLNLLEEKKDEHGGLFDGKEEGVWEQQFKLYAATGKKIFYSPSVANEFFPVVFDQTDGTMADEVLTPANEKKVNRVGDYVFFGTGDRAHPERKDIENAFYAIKNSWQWLTPGNPTIVEAYVDKDDFGKIKAFDGSVLVEQQRDVNGLLTDGAGDIIEQAGDGTVFLVDLTDNLIQNNNPDADLQELYSGYIKDAINHPSNRGWFIRLTEGTNNTKVGEKLVSTPIIYAGVVYFTTYIPEEDTVALPTDDPCANPGSRGNGYLYALDYKFGSAASNFYLPNDTGGKPVLERPDRRKKLDPPGIPPQPVIVVQEEGTSIITGFDKEDPAVAPNLLRRYWRQM